MEENDLIYNSIVLNDLETIKSILSTNKININSLVFGNMLVPPITLAIQYNRYDIFLLLCEHNVNVFSIDKLGWTSLHFAVFLGKKDMCKILISKQCDLHAEDAEGMIPLHYAVYFGHFDIFEMLLLAGSNLNHEDFHGRTPLVLAIEKMNFDLIKYLKPLTLLDNYDNY